MVGSIARMFVACSLLLVTACGYVASTQFNADGTVTVGLEFLFPKALLQDSTGTGDSTVHGFSAADVAKANAELQKQYPGARIDIVAEGDEDGAKITIPFHDEKDAFAFLTQPSTMNPTAITGGTNPPSVDLSNTGGVFATAEHTRSGATDTYTFTTQAATVPTPSPAASTSLGIDELTSIFTVTFSLTLPREITSAPGALFTLDRKTAVWKVNWVKSETFTATTSDASLAASSSAAIPPVGIGLTAAIAVAAAVLGLAVGGPRPWWRRTRAAPVEPAAPPAPVLAGEHIPSSELSPPADVPPPLPPRNL